MPAYTNDLDGRITWQNAAARAVVGDLRGLHFSEAVPPDELHRSRETFAAVTPSGATRRGIGGPGLVEQLLRLRPDARVLYMSGWYDHPQFPDVEREVLQKPFTREQLNTALAELLRDG